MPCPSGVEAAATKRRRSSIRSSRAAPVSGGVSPQGRARIRLGVDRDGQAHIQVLDARGTVIFQALK